MKLFVEIMSAIIAKLSITENTNF